MSELAKVSLRVPIKLVIAMDNLAIQSRLSLEQQAEAALARQNAFVFKQLLAGAKKSELRRIIFTDTDNLRGDGLPKAFADLLPDSSGHQRIRVSYTPEELTSLTVRVSAASWASVAKISKAAGNMTRADLFVLAMNRLLVFSAIAYRRGLRGAKLGNAIAGDLEKMRKSLPEKPGVVN